MLCIYQNMQPALCFLKKLDDVQSPKQDDSFSYLSHSLFYLLDYLTLGAGTDSFFQMVGMELPLYAV
jgi:hypothetical protein